ncbi:hypothetical protein BGZ75_000424 [Mortierella antarctica]|nr:hypothetical protein BGZ75_000424 [Mortierella antarctica]
MDIFNTITKNTGEYVTNTTRVVQEAADRLSSDVKELAKLSGADKTIDWDGQVDVQDFDLGSGSDPDDNVEPSFGADIIDVDCSNNYSDAEVYKTLMKSGIALIPLMFCAVQTAVMGYSIEGFGKYEFLGLPVDISGIYKMLNVQSDRKQGLTPGDLTPARLQRFYRAHIHKYLETNTSVEPYLWTKYSTHDVKYRSITFPGAESLITSKEEAQYLLDTYKCLDERLNTNIHERVRGVLAARQILA